MPDFHGKVVFITGAGGALGRAMTRLYATHGANLFLTDLPTQGFRSLANDYLGSGSTVATSELDVTRSLEVRAAMQQCAIRFGRIDVLIANAGIFPRKPFAEITDEEWSQTFAINVDGIFYCCREVLRHMPPGGTIVSLASIAAHRGSRDHAHYAATKGAALGLMRSLAWELAPAIRVNCVSPGPVESPMTADLMRSRGDSVLRQTPLGRLATPEEVAKTVLFVSSDWASHITGATLHVNGGSYIAG